MAALPVIKHPNLLVGYETADDAGVYKLTDELAIVQTLDFFPPIVNDPYQFGRIAAANSLSDVYAMGGRPLTAMNIVCFPSKDLPKEVLKEILRGGLEKIHEAGALLVGGHSVDDKELKYGLSVTGLIHPDRIITNSGAQVGDRLILTKPIGTGVITTAIKGKMASQSAVNTLIEVASTLNKKASEIMLKYGCHACTDITGFGLGGHLLEVARASKVEITIYADKIPLIPGAREYALTGLIPAGSYAIKHFCEKSVELDPQMETVLIDLVFDPQTSGGLLIALGRDVADACLKELKDEGIKSAGIIGDILSPHPKGRLKITHSNF
ncbi:MAG: selenide, water dikinase SelD [Thermodesulfovibrio sp. RBG_19FT_COMBO_42_12]|nr:MAG: selenide, water dikinase SelD [Thermodesulfovibrio sp. RBG_19FT_COMBO_42_12]